MTHPSRQHLALRNITSLSDSSFAILTRRTETSAPNPYNCIERENMLIRGMVRDDIPAVLQITDEGFKDDELVGWIYPYRDRYPEDLRRAHLFRLRSRLVAVGTHAFVAVTEQSDPEWNGTPEIVGYTMYMRTGQDEGSKEWTKDSWTNSMSPLVANATFTDNSERSQRLSDISCLGKSSTKAYSSIERYLIRV